MTGINGTLSVPIKRQSLDELSLRQLGNFIVAEVSALNSLHCFNTDDWGILRVKEPSKPSPTKSNCRKTAVKSVCL